MSALDELIRTDRRDAAYYADNEQLELIDFAANELDKLREAVEDAREIFKKVPFESWHKAGLWMEKYKGEK
jgi:hypothetical protein